MANPHILATHNGVFHADDVFACAFMSMFHPEPIEIVRTRDRRTIEAADIVIDVGYVYDPANLRFDHHQPQYTGDRSSVGMVLDWIEDSGLLIPFLAAYLRSNLVDELDDADTNGTTSAMSLLIWHMNSKKDCPTEVHHRIAFNTALTWAKDILNILLLSGRKAFKEQTLLENLVNEQANSKVLIFPRYMQELVWRVAQAHPTAKFCIWQAGDDAWMVQCIPPVSNRKGQRLPFPESIRGLRGTDLEAVVECDLGTSSKPESVFVHTGGFIGGAATEAGARALADFALNPQLPDTVVL